MTSGEGSDAPLVRDGAALDLTGPEADELLRTAAELAIEIARTGLRQQPPLDVPARLRPLLGHAKITKAALSVARRVVDDDAGFRARVARAVEVPGGASSLGRAGVLWLSRPAGWEDELGALVVEARAATATRAEGAEERTAQRRLRHAEEARDRAERAEEAARRAAEAARAELQEERRLRRAADATADRSARHATSLEEQLVAARRAVEEASARLAAQAEATARAAAAQAMAEEELVDLRAVLAALPAGPEERVEEPPDPAESPLLDRRALADAVGSASSAAAALGTALARAAAALGPDRAPAGGAPAGEAPVAAASARPARPATRPRWARSQPRGLRRRPVVLPPLVRDDSPEAATYLVSVPDIALLVDGYNATLSTWPDLPLPEQRLRLVDALAELAARTGARPEVVFDGTEEEPASRRLRSRVKVSFTAAHVEADDVLIARAHELPLPVVVASDDRRVRDGARAAGANVLGIEQLLAALRRKG